MNWLYPNFLRRIDHYLKINYPHVWRTRVHDFGWFSLILGNILAIGLPLLMIQRRNILSIEGINTVYWGGVVVLCFVALLWAMRLLQFKIKFSNFKTILVTWSLYVLGVASLAVNLTVFAYSMVSRTASFASITEVYADYYTLSHFNFIYLDHGIASDYYQSYFDEQGSAKMFDRYGFYDTTTRININDYDLLKKKMKSVRQANIYFELPLPSRLMDEGKPFHNLFWKHKIGSLMAAFFLPILLFFLSIFNLRTIMVSLFGASTIYGLSELLKISGYDMMPMLICTTMASTVVLAAGWRHFKNWNYVAGIFMLILGVILFISLKNSYVNLGGEGYWWDSLKTFIPFIFAPPLIAWIVVKRNALPES